MRRTVTMLSAMCLACLFVAAATAGEKKKQEQLKVEPVLAPNAAVIAKLKALGDGASCELGDPKVMHQGLGDFAKGWHRMKTTGPISRDFTIKMAWMPDRKRAFFCGANHGSPTRFNDAWEFDLAANTWVLLYVPDYNDRGKITDYDKKTLVMDKGWLRTKKGGPAHVAHTWWGLTYDPNIRAAVWYNTWPSYRLDAKLKAIGKTRADLYKGPPIWVFYPYKKKWAPMPTSKPWAKGCFGASLEYVPQLKGSLWQHRGGSWLLDTTQKKWTRVSGGVSMPIETLMCHDPERKLMIAHRGQHKKTPPTTWHYAIGPGGKGSWTKVLSKEGGPNGHDARSWMYFDPVSKQPLLYERGAAHIWSYDIEKKAWTKNTPKGPAPAFGKKERSLAFLDTNLNAFAVVGYNKVWCYRHKKAKATAKKK